MSDVDVLVPLDGSAEADRAVDVVAGLKPARALLLHVADGPAVPGEYFDGAAARLASAGIAKVERLAQGGEASKVILEVASKSGAGLIALSMHGRSGWDLLRLGTVAEKVIRLASVPVLALPKGEGTGSPAGKGLLEKVLAPQDGSAVAESALRRLLGLFPSAKAGLTLLGVVECFAGGAQLGAGDLASRFYQLQADELKTVLGRIAASTGLGSGADRVKIDLGRPAPKILDAAAALGSTLIAMGTHGRSGLTRWTLGSVAEQVLRATPVPVLVVR